MMEEDKIIIDEKIYREETLVTCRENQYYPIVFFMVGILKFVPLQSFSNLKMKQTPLEIFSVAPLSRMETAMTSN